MASAVTVGKDYFKLVERFPLLHIRNVVQLRKANEIIRELANQERLGLLSKAESEYLDALCDLVAAYESKHFDFGTRSTPVEIVRYLMKVNGLRQSDLAPVFGGQSRVSDFLTGKRSLSKGQIAKLCQRFRLSSILFLLSEAV